MPSPQDKRLKPIFRWAGSKRQILSRLVGSIPPRFNRYIEPFTGSASLFFHLAPQAAILGDLNSELIDAYRQIASRPRSVWNTASLLPNSEEVYYIIRATLPSTLTKEENAVRFLYLNRYCFNGLYRTNRTGAFNVPFGHSTGAFPEWLAFSRSAKLLKQADLIQGDFQETLSRARNGDFVYLDPPFADSRRNGRNEYGEGSFNANDIERLHLALHKLHAKGVRFLLSYSASPDFLEILRPRKIRRIKVPRMIAADPRFRRQQFEVLLNNEDLF
jgi:DNA adenine methylase